MARQAKPIKLHLLEGNKNRLTKEEIEHRTKNEIEPNKDKIEAPFWLDEIGKQEWDRIVSELTELELMTNLDVTALGAYCYSYSQYIKTIDNINTKGQVIEHTNKSGATNEVISPYVKIQSQHVELMRKFMTDFGLTPSARAKLAMPKAEQKEKTEEEKLFGDLL